MPHEQRTKLKIARQTQGGWGLPGEGVGGGPPGEGVGGGLPGRGLEGVGGGVSRFPLPLQCVC